MMKDFGMMTRKLKRRSRRLERTVPSGRSPRRDVDGRLARDANVRTTSAPGLNGSTHV